MTTAQEHAERIALALSANPTDGDWELCYLDTPKDEIGAYVQGCVNVSGGDKYHFIRALNADGIQVDVAHYGNGPRSNVNGYFACVANPAALTALLSERTALLAMVGELEGALRWYGEQSRLCRLIHSEGDAGRSALSEDGGQRARSALKGQP